MFQKMTGPSRSIWSMAAYVLLGSVFTISFQAMQSSASPETTRQAALKTNSKEAAKMGRPVVHFEIGCEDSAKTSAFYSSLFDWKIRKNGPGNDIDTGSKDGIQGHITSLGHEPRHYVTFYVDVDDIKSYLDKTKEFGGKVLVPAIKIPTGHFAWISDPDGNTIGLLQKN